MESRENYVGIMLESCLAAVGVTWEVQWPLVNFDSIESASTALRLHFDCKLIALRLHFDCNFENLNSLDFQSK